MRLFFALTLLLFCIPNLATAAPHDTAPEGYWLTEGGKAVVLIEKCKGDMLCGYFYWIEDKSKVYDVENEDPALQKRPLCGLPMLTGFVQDSDEPELWDDGKVYKSDEGATYSGYIKVINNDELYLRGYIGVSLFGKSQTWKRVSKSDYPACRQP
jgi:uncharacterized protein (DUF2147 family)